MNYRKILIFGAEGFGLEAARQLQSAHAEIVIVDHDSELLEAVAEHGFETHCCDYTEDAELRALGIGSEVDLVFCLLPEDSENVFLALSARSLAPDLRIVALATWPDAVPKLQAAGADRVIEPYTSLGRTIADFVHKPLVVDTLIELLYSEAQLNSAEIEITDGRWVGCRLQDVDTGDRDLLILGLVPLDASDQIIFVNTEANPSLRLGDILLVIGSAQAIADFRRAAGQS